ncbi:MAG: EndoU domain-containing protein [Halanaerobiales bacterium]|nr:EndoU domain-containing protein [Halanaerobiales bacterium]
MMLPRHYSTRPLKYIDPTGNNPYEEVTFEDFYRKRSEEFYNRPSLLEVLVKPLRDPINKFLDWALEPISNYSIEYEYAIIPLNPVENLVMFDQYYWYRNGNPQIYERNLSLWEFGVSRGFIKEDKITIDIETIEIGIDIALMTFGLDNIKDGPEAFLGKTIFSRKDLTPEQENLMLIPFISGAIAKKGGKFINKLSKGAANADEFVNLASLKRTKHILYGDKTGGGHLWPGKPGKSVFPKSWSAEKTMHNISDIVTDPKVFWKKGRVIKGVQRYEAIAIRDGVKIKVITDGKDIITAFPTK